MAAINKLSIKKFYRTEAKSRLNKNMEVYLTIYAYFISNLLSEIVCFIKLSKLLEYEGLCLHGNTGS